MSDYEKLYNQIKITTKKMINRGLFCVTATQPPRYNADGIPEPQYNRPLNEDFFFVDYDSSFR